VSLVTIETAANDGMLPIPDVASTGLLLLVFPALPLAFGAPWLDVLACPEVITDVAVLGCADDENWFALTLVAMVEFVALVDESDPCVGGTILGEVAEAADDDAEEDGCP